MLRRCALSICAAAMILTGCTRVAPLPPTSTTSSVASMLSPLAREAAATRTGIDRLYGQGSLKEAEEQYLDFVHKFVSANDPDVQDQVAGAYLRLGYIGVRTGRPDAAQRALDEGVSKVRESAHSNPNYGTVKEQVEYQAVALRCRSLSSSRQREILLKFVREHPESPLVEGCHQRLARLGKGSLDPEAERIFDEAYQKQQKRIAFETSICGQKCLERVLAIEGIATPPITKLADLSGHSDNGTSIAGLIRAFRHFGLDAVGQELNRQDFARLTPPAIWLQQDHYVVIESIDDRSVTVYEPRYDNILKLPLGPLDDKQFSATIVAIVGRRPEATQP